jgi:hypothetical protein
MALLLISLSNRCVCCSTLQILSTHFYNNGSAQHTEDDINKETNLHLQEMSMRTVVECKIAKNTFGKFVNSWKHGTWPLWIEEVGQGRQRRGWKQTYLQCSIVVKHQFRTDQPLVYFCYAEGKCTAVIVFVSIDFYWPTCRGAPLWTPPPTTRNKKK